MTVSAVSATDNVCSSDLQNPFKQRMSNFKQYRGCNRLDLQGNKALPVRDRTSGNHRVGTCVPTLHFRDSVRYCVKSSIKTLSRSPPPDRARLKSFRYDDSRYFSVYLVE